MLTLPKGEVMKVPAGMVQPGDFLVNGNRSFSKVVSVTPDPDLFTRVFRLKGANDRVVFEDAHVVKIVRPSSGGAGRQKTHKPVDRKAAKKARDREIRAAMKNGGRNK